MKKIKCKLNYNGNWLPDSEFELRSFSKVDRLLKAGKFFIIFFLLGIISVFIPVMHLFLVPSLLFLAFYISLRNYKQIYSLTLGELSCSGCGIDFKVTEAPLKRNEYTIRLNCLNCRKNTTIVIDGIE